MPRLFGRDLSRAELLRRVGHLSQVGGVRLLESADGPSRGVRLLEFKTGTGFEFKIGVERGMDVGAAEYCGASLAWIPPTMLAGPWYFEQQTEFGWLRTALGGFNNTCGLTHIGNPEEDDVSHYNFPARPRERFGVHDRAALIPGELMSFGERWNGDACALEAKGRVTQAQAYGEVLTLERTYRAWIGESRFTMTDVVTNDGHHPTQHMLLYHINAGFPFVDDGSEFLAPFTGPPKLLFGTADVNDPHELRQIHRAAARLGAADVRASSGAQRRRTRARRDREPKSCGRARSLRALRSQHDAALHRMADDGRGPIHRGHRAVLERLWTRSGARRRRGHCA